MQYEAALGVIYPSPSLDNSKILMQEGWLSRPLFEWYTDSLFSISVSSFRESIGFFIMHSINVVDVEIFEIFSQFQCFWFPAFDIYSAEIAFVVYAINDDPPITKDLELINWPEDCQSEGCPQTQQICFSIWSHSAVDEPLGNSRRIRSENAFGPTTKTIGVSSSIKTS